MFFPKFHCELNASERNWCHAKKHSRKYSNGSITRLPKIVPEALDTCTPELNRKFLEKVGITLELVVKDTHTGTWRRLLNNINHTERFSVPISNTSSLCSTFGVTNKAITGSLNTVFF